MILRIIAFCFRISDNQRVASETLMLFGLQKRNWYRWTDWHRTELTARCRLHQLLWHAAFRYHACHYT